MKYIFKSSRLGFCIWADSDLEEMYQINQDPEVMRYFPSVQTKEKTLSFIQKMQKQYDDSGYCYFKVEALATAQFLGFIGFCNQSFESPVTPCVDIGWRIRKNAWNKGYATEGAIRCLEYAHSLGIKKMFSFAVNTNKPSIRVMEKIGMEYKINFNHPLLIDYPELEDCVIYEKDLN